MFPRPRDATFSGEEGVVAAEGLNRWLLSCGTCIERREAFDLAKVKDPTPYAENAPSVANLRANDWRL